MKCPQKYQWVKLPSTLIPQGKGITGHWAKLASRAAFRNNQAKYCGYINKVTVGSVMDELSSLGHISYDLNAQTKKLTYKINDWFLYTHLFVVRYRRLISFGLCLQIESRITAYTGEIRDLHMVRLPGFEPGAFGLGDGRLDSLTVRYAQDLTLRIYAGDLQFDTTPDLQMEASPKRDAVTDAILGLLKKKRLVLI